MVLPPLPMTVFEEYMLLDGSPAYPMDCFCRFRFSGGFDHERFEQIFAELLAQNPFLYAHVRETKPSRYEWVVPKVGHDFAESIQHCDAHFSRIMGIRFYWIEGTCRGDYPKEVREPLEIFEEGMSRYFIVEEKAPNGTVLRTDWIIKCHHSASDGKGIFHFVEKFLTEYARQSGMTIPPGPQIPPTNISALITRHHYGRTCWERFKILMTCIAHLPRSIRLIFRKVQPIVNEPENDNEARAKMTCPIEGYPKILFRCLDQQTTANILKQCRMKQATFNDVMLQAVWCGTKSLRQKHPDKTFSGKKHWIRIAVPTNLRHPRQTNMPACNVVSMLFCDRTEKEIEPTLKFRARITKEMNHVKKYSLGFLLIQGMKDARNVCGHLRNAVKMCPCWATIVLTNIGMVFMPKTLAFPRTESGKLMIGENIVLDEIEACSPLRPQTTVSVCCITYAGEMHLSMVYDSRLMEEELADSYFSEILNSITEILKE